VTSFRIGNQLVGDDQPTYFIADIAANHDGSLERALDLMTLAKDAGADCAKFQHFRAPHIVSDAGFRALGSQQSHQSTWQKSVFEVYADASLPWEWTAELARHGEHIGIEFMSAPYDLEAVAHLNPFVNAFKVGSGDINWLEELQAIADLGKPVLLATGAASLEDVDRAMNLLIASGVDTVLMQCNTNYSGVLGAVALGARVIEKHFTDDTSRIGPDHGFSMDPGTWRAMVDATRELESALGSGEKGIEANERATEVLQRRCVRAASDLAAGHVLTRTDLVVLRPAPADGVPAHDVESLVGRTLAVAVPNGQHLRWSDLD